MHSGLVEPRVSLDGFLNSKKMKMRSENSLKTPVLLSICLITSSPEIQFRVECFSRLLPLSQKKYLI